MNWLTYNSFKYSKRIRLKRSTYSITNIVIIIICIIIVLTIISIDFTFIFPTSSISLIKSFQNTRPFEYIIRKSKELILINRKTKYSKFRCTGDENNINAWSERLCVFNNICYNIKLNQFEYYRQYHNPKYPLFYDSSRGMLTEFSSGQNGYGFLSLTSRGGKSWAPYVIDQSSPLINVTWLENLHTLWKEYFDDNNFGHMVWEDIGSIYYSLERMNEFDENLVIMHVTPIVNNSDFKKFEDNIVNVLTKNKILEYKSYLLTFKTNYICFKRFIAGGNLLLIHFTAMKENHGRENLLYKWRSKIIKYHKFDPEYKPNQHQILITNKSTSIFAKTSNKIHRAIVNLKEVVMFIKKTYPKISLQVIEWHKITFKNQLELLLKTTILISPSGGVSMIAPFLPHGSHAILMDYYVNDNSFGFDIGSSGSMEGMFLNHFPHFKKDYYQIYNEKDYVFDFNGTKDTRNDASILINTTRLHLLIESALADINL